MSPSRQDKCLRLLRVLCIILIAVTWLSSGAYKLLDMQDFRNVVYEQGVLPGFMHATLGAVPVAEIALGLVLGSSVYGSFSYRIWGLSLGATLGFMLYVALIPTETIEAVGCGCGGVAAFVQQGPWDAKAGHLSFLAVLASTHGGCLMQRQTDSTALSTQVG